MYVVVNQYKVMCKIFYVSGQHIPPVVSSSDTCALSIGLPNLSSDKLKQNMSALNIMYEHVMHIVCISSAKCTQCDICYVL